LLLLVSLGYLVINDLKSSSSSSAKLLNDACFSYLFVAWYTRKTKKNMIKVQLRIKYMILNIGIDRNILLYMLEIEVI